MYVTYLYNFSKFYYLENILYRMKYLYLTSLSKKDDDLQICGRYVIALTTKQLIKVKRSTTICTKHKIKKKIEVMKSGRK